MSKIGIGERLAEEVERIGGVSAVAARLETARNTIYNWAEKGNIPANKLLELAEMGADAIYILTGQRASGTLPPREAALLDNYRHSDDQGKRTIESVAGLAAQPPALKAGGEG
ncbi:MAG: bacteriophage CI repressor [Candidatus Contendobacter sp.]|mgnify:CR=1 FL=1|nr:MAG: bacteriophage CI repressor [Candidatus Contendobacter sp.]